MFVPFTGLRRPDAARVRWEDIDPDRSDLHRRNSKWGEERAFTIPLSEYVMEILKRGKEVRNSIPVAHGSFQRISATDRYHISKSPGIKVFRRPGHLPTACQEPGLSPCDIDVLTNHRPPRGFVSAGYIKQSSTHLRECQEGVTEHLQGKLGL